MAAGGFLALAAAVAIAFFYSHGWLLYYGDAEAHLNIARRVVDSQTPGYDQLGTPWLPVPHVLMLPLVTHDALWSNGLAGAIPSGICFVLAGVFLFLAARRVLGDDVPLANGVPEHLRMRDGVVSVAVTARAVDE